MLWGIGRLAHARPRHAQDAPPHLPPYLESPDPAIRGTAAWAALALPAAATAAHLARLRDDPAAFPLYEGGALADVRIGELVERELARPAPT
ncbi:MAG: hypothetical protein HY907_21145 [Deltaproteobacteria bacterium]|nr:hypothetical protein [Deltaproteobacteria bacterium]